MNEEEDLWWTHSDVSWNFDIFPFLLYNEMSTFISSYWDSKWKEKLLFTTKFLILIFDHNWKRNSCNRWAEGGLRRISEHLTFLPNLFVNMNLYRGCGPFGKCGWNSDPLPSPSFFWPGVYNIVSWGLLIYWSLDLNSGLEIVSKVCCKQMCCHSGVVVSFIEHMQGRFSIILKDSSIFRMANEHWLQL